MLSETTKQWLSKNSFDPNSINQPGKRGDTALILACRHDEQALQSDALDVDIRRLKSWSAR